MRTASAGEISGETESLPLRGRRQVHLQQRELLKSAGGQPERGKPAARGVFRQQQAGRFTEADLNNGSCTFYTTDVC